MDFPAYEGMLGYENIVTGPSGETHNITNSTRGILRIASLSAVVTGRAGGALTLRPANDSYELLAPGETKAITIIHPDGTTNATLAVQVEGGGLNRTAGHVKAG